MDTLIKRSAEVNKKLERATRKIDSVVWRFNKVKNYYGYGAAAALTAKKALRWYKSKKQYIVEIDTWDYGYKLIMRHADITPNVAIKKFAGVTAEQNNFVESFVPVPLDEDKATSFTIDKYTYTYTLNTPSSEENRAHLTKQMIEHNFVGLRCVIVCPTKAAMDYLFDWVDGLMDKQTVAIEDDGKPVAWIRKWDHGWRRHRLIERGLDTVILDEGELNGVLEDIQVFYDSRDKYVDKGIPWHRGYMLTGPPGTGKTSAIQAIATASGLDICPISIDKDMPRATFVSMIEGLPDECIVMIEDVDTMRLAQDRSKDRDNISKMESRDLYDVLDGHSSPLGVVFILTANNIDMVDEAILRPGRIDMRLEVGYCSDYQYRELIKYYYGIDPGEVQVKKNVKPVDLCSVYKNYVMDPSAGYKRTVDTFTLTEGQSDTYHRPQDDLQNKN